LHFQHTPGSAVSAYLACGKGLGCGGDKPGGGCHLTPEVSAAVGGGEMGSFSYLHIAGRICTDPESDVELGRPLWGLKLPVAEPIQ